MIDARMSEIMKVVELGDCLDALAKDQQQWSETTFGADRDRGPIGPLKRLAKEAAETIEAWEQFKDGGEHVIAEFADCFLLLLDASRRAGLSPLALVRAAQDKMILNKKRSWPVPKDDEPVENVRDAG